MSNVNPIAQNATANYSRWQWVLPVLFFAVWCSWATTPLQAQSDLQAEPLCCTAESFHQQHARG